MFNEKNKIAKWFTNPLLFPKRSRTWYSRSSNFLIMPSSSSFEELLEDLRRFIPSERLTDPNLDCQCIFISTSLQLVDLLKKTSEKPVILQVADRSAENRMPSIILPEIYVKLIKGLTNLIRFFTSRGKFILVLILVWLALNCSLTRTIRRCYFTVWSSFGW